MCEVTSVNMEREQLIFGRGTVSQRRTVPSRRLNHQIIIGRPLVAVAVPALDVLLTSIREPCVWVVLWGRLTIESRILEHY